MVVADECKIQREPNKYYRWNKRGDTPIARVDRKKGGMSIYGGLSYKKKRIIAYMTEKRQTSKQTVRFLDEIKKEYDGKGQVLLIWDGASHHMGEVKNWLRENPGVVDIMRFPPYSPELNPQEHVWKSMRNDISTVSHRYTYSQVIDRASRFLKMTKFDYDFGFTVDL